jgi:hypothetical protein
MDAAHPVELDNETQSDHLTTLESGETPTLDDGESPTIKALLAAKAARDDAEFNLVVARMPSDHRIKVRFCLIRHSRIFMISSFLLLSQILLILPLPESQTLQFFLPAPR